MNSKIIKVVEQIKHSIKLKFVDTKVVSKGKIKIIYVHMDEVLHQCPNLDR
jgi:hypothetical protein